jgi:dihydroneopterin aldolase
MPSDRLTLTGLKAFAHHGVFEHERVDGQEFVIDVSIDFDSRAAASGDDLDKTINYGTLAADIVAEVENDPVDLIETVAERIAALVLEQPRALAVEVTLHKPSAPITVPFDDVSITITRVRA